MTDTRMNSVPRWEARSEWVARDVEVELKGAEAEEAAAEFAKHTLLGGSDCDYGLLSEMKFVKEIRVWCQLVEIFRPCCEPIIFRVNRNKNGQITFTDTREGKTGIAGTTGLWGTLPPIRPVRPRSMTPTAFKVEAARFVGMERAEEIVREITQEVLFEQSLPVARYAASDGERG